MLLLLLMMAVVFVVIVMLILTVTVTLNFLSSGLSIYDLTQMSGCVCVCVCAGVRQYLVLFMVGNLQKRNSYHRYWDSYLSPRIVCLSCV